MFVMPQNPQVKGSVLGYKRSSTANRTPIRGGRYQVFSVRYDTEYFTFDTVDTILFSIPSILAYAVMVSIRASSIDVFRYMRAPHCACVKSMFPHDQEKSVVL